MPVLLLVSKPFCVAACWADEASFDASFAAGSVTCCTRYNGLGVVFLLTGFGAYQRPARGRLGSRAGRGEGVRRGERDGGRRGWRAGGTEEEGEAGWQGEAGRDGRRA